MDYYYSPTLSNSILPDIQNFIHYFQMENLCRRCTSDSTECFSDCHIQVQPVTYESIGIIVREFLYSLSFHCTWTLTLDSLYGADISP